MKKVAAPRKQNGATRPLKLEVLLKAKAREAGLEPQAVARQGKSRTIGEVRRGFIEAPALEQGYQASEVASFLGGHASNVSRALQMREAKFEQESQVRHRSLNQTHAEARRARRKE